MSPDLPGQTGGQSVGELLNAYLDHELTEAEHTRVLQALDTSPELRTELSALRQTRSLLRALPEIEPIRPLVRPAEQTGRRGTAAPSRSRRLALAATGVAAVWLVILSVGVSLGSLPVVPDVDQFALQHAAADTFDASTEMGFEAMTIEQMDNDPVVLDDIGHGMMRESIFQSADVVQVRYSDGLHALSVFHQPGDVNWDNMPPSGDVQMMDGDQVWTATMGDVDIMVLERGDLIVTIVADGDMDQEMTMAASEMLPAVDMDKGLWSKVADSPRNLIDRF